MDRLASITAFVRVAENGGFTAGARRLNVSTATVSENVQALENALGVRLLNRTTRQVSLTEIGRDYYERCVQILHDLEEADEAAGALQLTPRGQLRVYCHEGVSPLVAPNVTGFLARYPGSVGRFAHGPRHDRPGAGRVRPGDNPAAAVRLDPDKPTSGRRTVYLVLRPGLPRQTSRPTVPGRPRRS
jgi:DNA-binding transcriptional LysR family regulator